MAALVASSCRSGTRRRQAPRPARRLGASARCRRLRMRCGTRRTTGPPCPIRLDREGCRDAPTEVSSRFRFASIRPGAFPCLRQPGPGSLTGESRPTKNPHTRTPARWGPVALCRGLPHAGAPAGPIPVRSSGVPALRRSHPPCVSPTGDPSRGGGPGWSRFRTDPGPLPDRRGATPGRPGPRLSGFRQAAKAMPGGGGRVPGRRTQPGSCDVGRPPGVRLR